MRLQNPTHTRTWKTLLPYNDIPSKQEINSNLNQSMSMVNIVMTEQEGKLESMERELAAAKAENAKLKAVLEKERTEKKELADTLNSFAPNIQDESDSQDYVIQPGPLHGEFPLTESEATA
jgi:hypothetical protein